MEKDSSSGLERAIPALIKSSEASQCLLESLLRLGVALLRSHTNEVSLIAVVPSVPCLQETSCLWRGDGLMRRESLGLMDAGIHGWGGPSPPSGQRNGRTPHFQIQNQPFAKICTDL